MPPLPAPEPRTDTEPDPAVRFEDGWDVVGPVRAEVFVVFRHGTAIELTGPCGPDPWYLQLADSDHPVQVVDSIVSDVLGPPRLVHSTSWRRDHHAVILTFLVVIDPPTTSHIASPGGGRTASQMASVPITRTDLARSQARAAPATVAHTQVLEHALRHLAWLADDDPVVAHELDPQWRQILTGYTPEPFRALG